MSKENFRFVCADIYDCDAVYGLFEEDKPESLITHVTDRKGHDQRYAMDPAKIHGELGWLPETRFEDGIRKKVQWYLDNRDWGENRQHGKKVIIWGKFGAELDEWIETLICENIGSYREKCELAVRLSAYQLLFHDPQGNQLRLMKMLEPDPALLETEVYH